MPFNRTASGDPVSCIAWGSHRCKLDEVAGWLDEVGGVAKKTIMTVSHSRNGMLLRLRGLTALTASAKVVALVQSERATAFCMSSNLFELAVSAFAGAVQSIETATQALELAMFVQSPASRITLFV